MSDAGWGIIFLLGIITSVAAIISITVWQGFRTQQTKTTSKVALTHDGAYRALAEETSATIRQYADQQARIASELGDLRNRLAKVEKLLSDVG